MRITLNAREAGLIVKLIDNEIGVLADAVQSLILDATDDDDVKKAQALAAERRVLCEARDTLEQALLKAAPEVKP